MHPFNGGPKRPAFRIRKAGFVFSPRKAGRTEEQGGRGMGTVRVITGGGAEDLEIDITVRSRRRGEECGEASGGRGALPTSPEEHLGRDGEWW